MQRASGRYQHGLLSAFVLLFGVLAGCRSLSREATWRAPRIAVADTRYAQGSTLSPVEAAYALAMEREAADDPTCVDHFYRATTLAWPFVASEIGAGHDAGSRSAELYHSALTQLIVAGQRYRRFDPRGTLTVQTPAGWQFIPIVYHGFPWRPADFDQLVPVGEYQSKRLNNSHCVSGLGVATVAVHHGAANERFLKAREAWAATAILKPATPGADVAPFALHVYDPLRVHDIALSRFIVPLQRDITAPIAFQLKDEGRTYLQAFLQPGSTIRDTGLFMIEPYQPGKIPVVFVHGLLSDPFTWANLANEVRAQPDLIERYQIWGFEYATGEPFLRSAARLRRQLREVQMRMDPVQVDRALGRIVLVGHSMGGLVSKLQVTSSGDALWRSVSQRPLETIVTDARTRMSLAESFYFNPSSLVSRVVYMATPHRGSPWAERPIGQWGSSLVEEPSTISMEHEQLIRDNPGVFSPEFTRRLPTSIDLLRPDSELLKAIDSLPIAGHVRQHSIIGSFRPMIGAGDSDGVVPVASARHPGVISEKVIRARHSAIHQNQEGIDELLRILREHLHGL